MGRLTNEDKKNILQMYQERYSISKIGRNIGCTRGTVINFLKKNGYEIGECGHLVLERKHETTGIKKEAIAAIIQAFSNLGNFDTTISENTVVIGINEYALELEFEDLDKVIERIIRSDLKVKVSSK